MQNAPREHSAILSTCIKVPSVFKTFVLFIFELPLKTGFTVQLLSYRTKLFVRWMNGTCIETIPQKVEVEENLPSGFADKPGADQPAHLRSLISAFVIRCLKSIIFKLATGEFSIF